MKPPTRYAYEKRIRELEARTERLERQRDRYRTICIQVFDWLAPFAGDSEKVGKTPNAAYGIKLMRDLLWGEP